MKFNYYICQGRTIFGQGDTPEAAIADVRSWMDAEDADTLDDLPVATGARESRTGSWPSAMMMTSRGELNDGDLVIFDAASAEAYGIEDLE